MAPTIVEITSEACTPATTAETTVASSSKRFCKLSSVSINFEEDKVKLDASGKIGRFPVNINLRGKLLEVRFSVPFFESWHISRTFNLDWLY